MGTSAVKYEGGKRRGDGEEIEGLMEEWEKNVKERWNVEKKRERERSMSNGRTGEEVEL